MTSAMPDGSYVEWQGRVYPGSVTSDAPESAVLFSDLPEDELFRPGRVQGWRRIVPLTEVTVFTLTSQCRWRGEPFSVGRSPAPGRLRLGWLGGDETRARELGLTRVDEYAWEVTVPESEVTDVEQIRSTA